MFQRCPSLARTSGTTVLQIVRGSSPERTPRRLVWCPHVGTAEQNGEEAEEDSLLLAASHGSEVRWMFHCCGFICVYVCVCVCVCVCSYPPSLTMVISVLSMCCV